MSDLRAAEQQAVKVCMSNRKFCPISPSRAAWFWSTFSVVAAGCAAANVFFMDPLLLALFAVPAVYLGLMKVPLPLYIGGNALIVVLVALVCGWNVEAIVPSAAVVAISLITRRATRISMRHFSQQQKYEELFMDTMLSFAKSIDTRDPYTAFHSRNVADYARGIAEELGLSKEETEAVYLAGLIHDIGKIGTPEHILRKESRLTEEEYDIMKKHPEEGYGIIKNISRLAELGITDMVRHHHERVDGKGYPLGLKGNDIPLGARILAAADAFDAMTTNRSYRQKLSAETAAEELRRCSGAQFDANVAAAFLRVLERGGRLRPESAVAPGVAVPSAV